MVFKTHCENANCGKVLTIKAELAGKRVKCPACGKAMLAPQSQGNSKPSGAALVNDGLRVLKPSTPYMRRWPLAVGTIAAIGLLAMGLVLLFSDGLPSDAIASKTSNALAAKPKTESEDESAVAIRNETVATPENTRSDSTAITSAEQIDGTWGNDDDTVNLQIGSGQEGLSVSVIKRRDTKAGKEVYYTICDGKIDKSTGSLRLGDVGITVGGDLGATMLSGNVLLLKDGSVHLIAKLSKGIFNVVAVDEVLQRSKGDKNIKPAPLLGDGMQLRFDFHKVDAE